MDFEKYLDEDLQKIKTAIKKLDDNKLKKDIRNSYYGVSDNIDNLVKHLYRVSQIDFRFRSEYKNAADALRAFEKLNIGKIL